MYREAYARLSSETGILELKWKDFKPIIFQSCAMEISLEQIILVSTSSVMEKGTSY